jgi:hypothetical protein
MTDFIKKSSLKTTTTNTSSESQYAVIMETNAEECESWYYFVKYNGNEKKLHHLSEQIDQIEMYLVDDLSTFDIELEHLVSEQTAKQMTKLEINSVSFHRKFDGVLKTVNLGLKRKDSNEKRIERINDILGMGSIDNFIDEEDIDPEDRISDASESEHSEDEDLIPMPMGSPERCSKSGRKNGKKKGGREEKRVNTRDGETKESKSDPAVDSEEEV